MLKINKIKKATATDFIMDSHLKCFFCFKSKIPPPGLKSMTGDKYEDNSPLHSLHYLYRYLELNISDMLNLELSNSTQLNVNRKAPRQRVKVYLCDECTIENEIFGKLYQRLEKIQMELLFSLETIHLKLATCDKAKVRRHHVNEFKMANGHNETVELVQTVRIKTMEKCSLRLERELPRIMLKKLSEKVPSPGRTSAAKSAAVEDDVRSNSNSPNYYCDQSKSHSAGAVKLENVKVENTIAQDEMSNESGSDYFNDYSSTDSEDQDGQQFQLPSVGTQNVNNLKKTEGEGANEGVDGGYSYTIIKPTKIAIDLLKPMNMQSIVEPKNGEHKCKFCLRKFLCLQSFQTHYRSKHLNERYKCTYPQCGKIFSIRSTYYRHHQQMHMGISLICNVCKNCFATKSSLKRHHRMTSCGKGFPPTPVKHTCQCRSCGKGFTNPENLRRHHRTVHLQLMRFECNLCEMKFKRSDKLKDHRCNIHQERKIKSSQVE